MAFVLDASVTSTWVLPDECKPVGEAALRQLAGEEAWAPALWWFEVRNALVMAERRQRIGAVEIAVALRSLARLPVIIDRAPDEDAVLDLARRHGLTVYDAAYLELAVRKGVMLATVDRALLRAASAEGVPLLSV